MDSLPPKSLPFAVMSGTQLHSTRRGRSPGSWIFLLAALPETATFSIRPLQWSVPRSSPVTVAGAAPDLHRLPF